VVNNTVGNICLDLCAWRDPGLSQSQTWCCTVVRHPQTNLATTGPVAELLSETLPIGCCKVLLLLVWQQNEQHLILCHVLRHHPAVFCGTTRPAATSVKS